MLSSGGKDADAYAVETVDYH
jgi:hypothetical protein